VVHSHRERRNHLIHTGTIFAGIERRATAAQNENRTSDGADRHGGRARRLGPLQRDYLVQVACVLSMWPLREHSPR
jgi:hypothetical protein